MRKSDTAKAAKRRQQIIEAAIVCFKEKGFHGASMSAICSKAGMSPGHLYHYFSSKLDLIEAIVDINTQEALSDMKGLMDSNNTIDTLIEQVTKYWSADDLYKQELNAEILAEAVRNKRVANILHHQVSSLSKEMSRALDEAKKKGQINQNLDTEGFSTMMIGMFFGLSSLYAGTGKMDEGKAVSSICEMLTRMLSK